jgi:hypothetical protein
MHEEMPQYFDESDPKIPRDTWFQRYVIRIVCHKEIAKKLAHVQSVAVHKPGDLLPMPPDGLLPDL